jgi:hypothetical protein
MAPHGTASFQQHFQDLQDPRVERTRKHPLINIVFMTVCGVLSGANSIAAIHEFAIDRRSWLARYLDLSSGIPSEDTFGRVLARLDPAAFEKCLLGWIRDVQELTEDRVVAIDGKTLRGSADHEAGRAAIHMVSAWATANKLSLGQVVVAEKSNEITAIPNLLDLLEIAGALVTIDAMGCQREIAGKIRDRKADYILAVKQNQPTLSTSTRPSRRGMAVGRRGPTRSSRRRMKSTRSGSGATSAPWGSRSRSEWNRVDGRATRSATTS